jgi:SAM-dependent methyltransferase
MTREDYSDGYFYQTIDLPGLPTIAGAWDLRKGCKAYLGNLDYSGKRVLEIGAANGFLTFSMERLGAEVVPFDLSPGTLGDIMKRPERDYHAFEVEYRRVVGGLNRAWGHAREAFGSRTELVHGSAYALPSAIGAVDITLFGSVLLHLRDPYSALEQAARVTRGRIVVTDLHAPPFRDKSIPRNHDLRAGMLFDPSEGEDPCTWWFHSPRGIQRMLRSLGFKRFDVILHKQTFRPGFTPWGAQPLEKYKGPEVVGDLFTLVAERA